MAQVLALERAERDFSIVFRTFGVDLADVADEWNSFCTGEHPCYPGVQLDGSGSSGIDRTLTLPDDSGAWYRYGDGVRSSKLTVPGSHSSLHTNRYRVFGRGTRGKTRTLVSTTSSRRGSRSSLYGQVMPLSLSLSLSLSLADCLADSLWQVMTGDGLYTPAWTRRPSSAMPQLVAQGWSSACTCTLSGS